VEKRILYIDTKFEVQLVLKNLKATTQKQNNIAGKRNLKRRQLQQREDCTVREECVVHAPACGCLGGGGGGGGGGAAKQKEWNVSDQGWWRKAIFDFEIRGLVKKSNI
jgi:hypothetical protein